LDSVAKKIRELDAMISTLGLQGAVTAIATRAESLARSECGGFAVVTARAVSELPALVELAAPLLAECGWLVCFKGSPVPEELERGNRVASLLGMREEYRRSVELPQGAGRRTLVCYVKIGDSSVAVPRREGLAQHSPLA
jgi:16S rRNA (guanine527-N7)-methyltransferase